MADRSVPTRFERLSGRKDSFFERRLMNIVAKGPLVACVCAAFQLLFLIPDLAIIEAPASRLAVICLRAAFSLLLAVFAMWMRRIQDFPVLCLAITFFETAMGGIFMVVLNLYDAPDFLIQTFGLIMMIILIYLIPNRWGNMIFMSSWIIAAFFLGFPGRFPNVPPMEFGAALVYAAAISVMGAFFARQMEHAKSREFEVSRELEIQLASDYLTHALSRQMLEKEAAFWMDFCRREQFPLAVAFIDVDNLKTINDEFGHQAGDKVLVEVVGRMRGLIRKTDVLARWGGDEFVLLMPDSTTGQAVELCGRIRLAIMSERVDEDIPVTCSFGVAGMQPDSTFGMMMDEADRFMYRSKRLGKNRIEYL